MRGAAPRCSALFFALVAALATAGAVAQDAPSRFDAGVAAYEAGDVAGALAAFEAEQAAGLDSPQLHLNLGLCHYRLGHYAAARREFEQLAQSGEWRDIARFHLGLVAAREGDPASADALWGELERDASDPAVRERSRIARSRLDGVTPAVAGGYVLAAIGHDSNPSLLDEALQPAGGGSMAREVFGAFDLPLASQPQATTWLHGGAWSRDYDEDLGLDQRGLFGGLARERVRQGRRRQLSLDLSATTLDGESFTRMAGAGLESSPAPGQAGATRRLQLARIGAGSTYRHLEGWRLRAEVERASGTLRPGLQLELNDREDLDTGTEFFSHSPLRARLSLALDRDAGAWSLRASARYRHSRCLDPDRFLDGSQLREERRVENLVQGSLRARRTLGATTFWLIEYQYSRNAASIEAFDYDRHQVLTGLEWLPRAD